MATIVTGKNPRKPHTVRYQDAGRQREKSFATAREARDFKIKFEHDSRQQIFVDPRLSGQRFADAAEAWIASLAGKGTSKDVYRKILRNHIGPAIGSRTLAQVAGDRDGVRHLLNVTLPAKNLGASQVRTAYIVIRATVGDAIKSGKLTSSRLSGIPLPAADARAEFVFASHAQLVTVAGQLGPQHSAIVWLMRGCGLRLGEALAVGPHCLRAGGVLRISEQLLTTGEYGPLKHRDAGDYRDVPVPAYVAEALAALPAPIGRYYFDGAGRRTVTRWFRKGCDLAGLPASFTTHALRHTFASVALANDVPITDVSKWLGHQNINTTYAIYGHLVPSSWNRAKKALDSEYATWATARPVAIAA